MTCLKYGNGFVCVQPHYRLRLDDGGYVFMSWHSYCGPEFYKDKYERDVINNWWEDPLICKALEWFQGRGNKA